MAPFNGQQARTHQDACGGSYRGTRADHHFHWPQVALIPPGEFMMGSPKTEEERDPEAETLHRARITKPFYMAVYEVTQDEFDGIMGYNPSYRAADSAQQAELRCRHQQVPGGTRILDRGRRVLPSFIGVARGEGGRTSLPTPYGSGVGVFMPGRDHHAISLWDRA